MIFGLNRLKADLLLDLKRPSAAAEILFALARSATRHRQVLDLDLVPLLSQAASIFEAQGDYRRVGQILTDKLDEGRDGGRSGAVLGATLEDLAPLSDLLARLDDAANYRAAAIRARSGNEDPAEFYGYGRGKLELGIATGTIRVVHTPGRVGSPSLWRLEFGPSPAKHVVLQSVTPVETDAFYMRLNAEFGSTGKTEAFVFVHGFNLRFDQASKRAVQIAYDMGYDGVPIVYSWPSQGSTVSYVADTAVVQLSARRLTGFLMIWLNAPAPRPFTWLPITWETGR